MAGWTAERVIALAPDAASASAGRGLAGAGSWPSVGRNTNSVWGEAKGSGTKPYQVVVALADGASRCSCPSRKFPCKHALGLLLRVAGGEIPAGESPAWASEWIEGREKREAAKTTEAKTTEAKSSEAKSTDGKSAEKRWGNVLKGLDECEAFLHDAVAGGLLTQGSTRTWDEMAARMVDAQAPGVARRLRRVGEIIGVGEDWAPKAAAELGSLSLLVQAARNVETLGDDLGSDVRTALGLPARREELPEGVGVVDVWDVLGEVVETVDRLQASRSWLRGRETGRWALHLAFAPMNAAALVRPFPGASFAAEARFFPSAWPLRAQFDEMPYGESIPRSFATGSGTTWAEAFAENARALAANPWTERLPVHLREATLGHRDERWFAVDAEGIGVPLASEQRTPHLLGRTGNAPANLFGEFDGRALRIVSAWNAEGFFAP